MTAPELVAATYLEVADRHRDAIKEARQEVATGNSDHIEQALVEIDEAMRAVIADDH